MAKHKEISIGMVDEVIKNKHKEYTEIGWNGQMLCVKNVLSLGEVKDFVDAVVKNCFSKEDFSYTPEFKDYLIKAATISLYSNVRLPEKPEHQYRFIYCTDLYIKILSSVDRVQYEAMIKAIDEKIKYLASSEIKEKTELVDQTLDTLTDLTDKMSKVMNGIDEDDIEKVLGAIENFNFDENKMVKAYMENLNTEEVDKNED